LIRSDVVLKPETSMAASRRESRVKIDSGYSDFKWLSGKDLTRYQGKWIVVRHKRILAADQDLEKAIRKAKLPEGATPFIRRVPKEPHLALAGDGLGARALL